MKGAHAIDRVLTICVKCCRGSAWLNDADQLDQIIKKTPGNLILGLSDKEDKEVLSS